MPPAMDEVLSKPELVEAILLQLPNYDLLVTAQRLSRYFHATITSSPSLQRKLFFTPKPTVSRGPSDCVASGLKTVTSPKEWELNPLLCKAFPPWFENVQLHFDYAKTWNDHDFRKLDWNSSEKKTAAYARQEASWRRMLVSQPPVTNLRVIKSASHRGGTLGKIGGIQLSDGIRMGTLYDLVETHMISWSPVSSFVLRWHILGNETPYIPRPYGMQYDITVDLNHVFQCSIGTMGRGFRVDNVIQPWIFHSYGYELVKVDFEDISDQEMQAIEREQALAVAMGVEARLAAYNNDQNDD